MGGLFSKPKVPDPEPPATMPDEQDELAQRARRTRARTTVAESSSAPILLPSAVAWREPWEDGMEEVSVLGQILVPIGASIMQMDYISWQNRCWLVPHWLEDPSGDIRPLRLIAPKMAAGFSAPPGPDFLEMFRNMPLPAPTYDQGHIPAELENVVLIVENPPVFVRG